MHQGEGRVESSEAGAIQHGQLIFGVAAIDKQQVNSNDHVEVIGPWSGRRKSAWLSLLFCASITGELPEHVLDDVLPGASCFQESCELFHIWMAQVDMGSEDHALLSRCHLVGAGIGIVDLAMAVEHYYPFIVDLQDRGPASASLFKAQPFAIQLVLHPRPSHSSVSRSSNWKATRLLGDEDGVAMKLSPSKRFSWMEFINPLFKIGEFWKLVRSSFLVVDPFLDNAVHDGLDECRWVFLRSQRKTSHQMLMRLRATHWHSFWRLVAI